MRGIGVDIVEFDRISRVFDNGKFVDKILSDKEKKVFTSIKNEKRKLEFLAGRWAAKEAIYKAAPDLCINKAFKDFSILNHESGAPYLDEPLGSQIMITISHSENYVVAFVVYT